MMTVFISFCELSSWLSLAPLKALVDITGITLTWKPMPGSPGNVADSALKAGEGDPLAQYKARRADARHKAARREQERACERLGIPYQQGTRKIDPMILSTGLNWLMQQRADATQVFGYVEAAFQKTYVTFEDVESLDTLTMLLDECGVTTEGLGTFADREKANIYASINENLEPAVFNAPAFVIDGEVFHGREHLPLIEWMLTGRQGIPPV